ncbi:immunity repressor [Mycobacterium phage Guillsminger]|nr:immunity repressor [Mycobacterium phage Guillsminger]
MSSDYEELSDLAAVLTRMTGGTRIIQVQDIADALGQHRQRITEWRKNGKLYSATVLADLALRLGLNRVELLASYNIVTDEEVLEYAEEIRRHPRIRPAARGVTAIAPDGRTATTPQKTSRRKRRTPRGDADPL